MRVLFTTWAWPSHYFPMVPLAWALRAAGHEVRMTSQPSLLPTMRDSGLPCTAVGEDVEVAGVYRAAIEEVRRQAPTARPGAGAPSGKADRISAHLAAHVPADSNGLRIVKELEDETIGIFQTIFRQRWARTPHQKPGLSLYGEIAEAMTPDLLALARSWRPDLIVFDPLTQAGPLVARLIGVPAVRNLFGPDVTFFLKNTGLTPLLERYGLGVDVFSQGASPTPGAEVDLLGDATVDPSPPGLHVPDSIAAERRIQTRYIPYPGLAEVPASLPPRTKRERICLTWGTSIHRLLGPQAFLPPQIVQGAAKLADEREAELVLAITARQRPMLPELPDNVTLVESVPLDVLLPTCDALIHQGGAGTLLTGLRSGLPQIVLTQVLDEAANALGLEQAGAALTRRVAGLTAGELLSLGHELLDEPGFRASATRLREEIFAAPTPAEIVPSLVALAGRG